MRGYGADIAVALEVGDIERENGIDQVNAHDGDQAGIIDLDALNAVVLNEPLPNRIDRRNVRQQSQQVFDAGDFLERFLVRESQSVDLCGPGSHIPKLGDVLGAEEDGVLCRNSFETAAVACEQSGWVGWALRKRIFVSTRTRISDRGLHTWIHG